MTSYFRARYWSSCDDFSSDWINPRMVSTRLLSRSYSSSFPCAVTSAETASRHSSSHGHCPLLALAGCGVGAGCVAGTDGPGAGGLPLGKSDSCCRTAALLGRPWFAASPCVLLKKADTAP